MGLGECGELLKDVAMCGARVPHKPYEPIYINRKFSVNYFDVTVESKKAFACVLPTVGFGRCGDMREDMRRYGELLLIKASD